MFRLVILSLTFLLLGGTQVLAKDALRGLPPAVASYAQQFDEECKSNGLGHVVTSENFEGYDSASQDVNGDGKTDYFIYKCMFGCSGKPSAFTGRGTPCAWGSLLMSGEARHSAIFLPGMVSRVSTTSAVRVAITRPRALRINGNYCKDPFPEIDAQHVYELKDGRFQLVGMCPAEGCASLLDKMEAASDAY